MRRTRVSRVTAKLLRESQEEEKKMNIMKRVVNSCGFNSTKKRLQKLLFCIKRNLAQFLPAHECLI